MTRETEILTAVIEECRQHAKRLNYAYGQISSLLLLNAAKVEELKEEEISYLDQYIFRFSKLQDAMGQKLFKAVLGILGEVVHNKAFIDVFNRLEQLGVIENYARWQELRIIRNEVAHEYNESKSELAEKLNKILNSKEFLEKYLNDVLYYVKTKELS